MSAKKILLLILLISLSYVGCKNTDSDNNKHNEQSNALKKTWYKRFTGTVNGQPVIVNIQCSGKNTQGTYYYIDKGIIINLVPSGNGSRDMSNIAFTENNPA